MPLVPDASIVLAWCFEDEDSPVADHVLEMLGHDSAITPAIWPFEIANALRTAERRGRLQPAATLRLVALLGNLPISVDSIDLDRALGNILRVGCEHGLSCYDAAYLELAMREGLPLATTDVRLAQAASAAGVELVR
jgi:predicted nucleic acid-binding protein